VGLEEHERVSAAAIAGDPVELFEIRARGRRDPDDELAQRTIKRLKIILGVA
jgi:hypothetical protein